MLKIHHLLVLVSVLGGSLCIETNIDTEVSYFASNILVPFKVQVGQKYYFIESNKKLNWYAAAEHCRQIGGHLWDIQDAYEMDEVLKHLKLADYWLAGSDLAKEGNYVSIASGFKMPYVRWHKSQPDNSLGRENCIHILYRNNLMRMNDHHCEQLKHFVCEANVPKTVSVTVW